MAENVLEGSHQVFIVQHLAMFERPKAVQKLLKQNFDVDISLQAVCYYEISNGNLSKDLKKLFTKTRNDFLKDSSKIPIAQKSYRLMKLYKMFEAEEDQNPAIQNKKAMRELLKQAALEAGDAFTNKQKVEHTGADGGPIKTENKADLSKLSTEELLQLQEIQSKLKNA